MKNLMIIFLFILPIVLLSKYDITLESGGNADGVLVGKRGKFIYLQKENLISVVNYDDISEIKKDYNAIPVFTIYNISDFMNVDINSFTPKYYKPLNDFEKDLLLKPYQIKKTELSKPYLLALGLSSGMLAWNYFDAIHKINKSTEIKSSKLRENRTRYYITGFGLATSSLFCFYYSYDRYKIEVTPSSLSIKF